MAEIFVDPHLFMYDPAKYILISKEEVRKAKFDGENYNPCPNFLCYGAPRCESLREVADTFCALCKKLTEFAEEDEASQE